jgi:hypothetical protein
VKVELDENLGAIGAVFLKTPGFDVAHRSWSRTCGLQGCSWPGCPRLRIEPLSMKYDRLSYQPRR